jgi:hypothetical protein
MTLPKIDFATLVMSLSQTALVHLGAAPNPESSGPAEIDLELARQTIDLLDVLQEKTKGNLSGEEERLLNESLFDLRTRFVQISRAKN